MKHAHEASLVEAIDLLQQHEWQRAHVIVQDLEDPLAYRLHGLVHRLEGDLDNARYWYHRAGVAFDESLSIDDEIASARSVLRS